jgi:hypothetical protein
VPQNPLWATIQKTPSKVEDYPALKKHVEETLLLGQRRIAKKCQVVRHQSKVPGTFCAA